MAERVAMDIEIITTLIFVDKEYTIIDMKYIRARHEKNPFLLQHYWIQRGEILIGDYVRSIKAVWTVVENNLILKEISYKKDAFTISSDLEPIGDCETMVSEGVVMETMTIMDGFEFTGRLRLARDAVSDQFVNSKDNPLAFQTIIDITVHNGQIVGVIDRSQEVEEWRRALKKEGSQRIVPLIDL